MWIKDIGAWGDSITYGAGDTESLGWVGRLRRHVEKEHATAVYNFGVSGDTSVDLMKRFEIELESVEPQLVLVAIGTNDSVFKSGDETNMRVPLALYRSNLEKIFAFAKAKVPHMYAVGLTKVTESLVQPVPWSTSKKSYANRLIDAYDDVLRDTAALGGVGYIPLRDLLTPTDLADGLHPNAAGYEKMYLKIYETLAPLLT